MKLSVDNIAFMVLESSVRLHGNQVLADTGMTSEEWHALRRRMQDSFQGTLTAQCIIDVTPKEYSFLLTSLYTSEYVSIHELGATAQQTLTYRMLINELEQYALVAAVEESLASGS